MYHLHVKLGSFLGSQEFHDRKAWEHAALTSFSQGAKFVLMHCGDIELRSESFANLAKSLPEGIYLSESARLSVDPAQSGHAEFVPNQDIVPLYRSRIAPGNAPPERTEVAAVPSPANDPEAPAKRPRGRPRKDPSERGQASSGLPQPGVRGEEVVQPALDEAYLSSREFFASLLGEGEDMDDIKAYLGFKAEAKSIVAIALDRGIGRAGMDLRINRYLRVLMNRPVAKSFFRRLRVLMNAAEAPLKLLDVPEIDAWFCVDDLQDQGFQKFASEVGDGLVYCVDSTEGLVLSPVSRQEWSVAQRKLKVWLDENANAALPASVEALNQAVLAALPGGVRASFANFLLASVGEGRLFLARTPDGRELVAGYGRGIEPKIRAVLLASDVPLHIAEIVARFQKQFDPTVTIDNIRNEVVKSCLPFAKSVYGLSSHIDLCADELREMIAAAEEVVLDDPARQWTSHEIAEAMIASGRFTDEAMSRHLVNLVLKVGPTRLRDMKKGVWALGEDGQKRRIKDIVYEALVRSGRTMTNDELKSEIEQIRGLGANCQIQPDDRLILVGKATWGLLERDLPVTEDQAKAWLQLLRDSVIAAGHGLHRDEVPSILASRGMDFSALGDVTLLIAFSRRFGGLKITRNGYFILPEWADERLPVPRKVLPALIDANLDKSSSELALLVSAQCGRSVGGGLILNILEDMGYSFDPATGCWATDKVGR